MLRYAQFDEVQSLCGNAAHFGSGYARKLVVEVSWHMQHYRAQYDPSPGCSSALKFGYVLHVPSPCCAVECLRVMRATVMESALR